MDDRALTPLKRWADVCQDEMLFEKPCLEVPGGNAAEHSLLWAVLGQKASSYRFWLSSKKQLAREFLLLGNNPPSNQVQGFFAFHGDAAVCVSCVMGCGVMWKYNRQCGWDKFYPKDVKALMGLAWQSS